MPGQSVRVLARRAPLEAQAQVRADREAWQRRVSDLGVTVSVALAQRQESVTACEQRAGQALAVMTEQEGLSLREAARWCGAGMTAREAGRLRQLADHPATHQDDGSASPGGAGPGKPPTEPTFGE